MQATPATAESPPPMIPGRFNFALLVTLVIGLGSTAILYRHFVAVDCAELVRTLERASKAFIDGRQGLDYYREHWREIDIVVIDMIMPNVGGLDCLESMYAINPGIRAILASGFSRDAIADKINEQHIMGFLQKPFRLQELSDLLSAVER